MDPTDIVIESLLKAASTEVVKRGIEAISTRLRAVFDRGNRAEIKKVIEEENLTSPVAQLAKQSLDSSYIIPFSSLNEARPQHKVDFFYQILKFGFKASRENKMDILIPGSFIGVNNLSLFSTKDNIPSVAKSNLNISMPNSTNNGFYSIIPTGDDSTKVFNTYKDKVRSIRNDSENYIEPGHFFGKAPWHFCVERISAGSVYFKYGVIFTKEQKAAVGVTSGNQALMASWAEGIRTMIQRVEDYPSLSILPPDDGILLMELADELRNFYGAKQPV